MLDKLHRARQLVGGKMLPFRRLHLWVLASLIVIVAMLQFLTVNGVLGREGRSRPSLPDHLEMPLPAKWTELSHSTWTCTEELEEQEVDRALVALDNSSGSEARAKLEAEKASIQRRKQCIVKNMCVDGNGAFILSSGDNKNLPKINMISADKTADTYWQPRVKSVRGGIKAHYVDEVLFVRGLYSPFHLSHYLYNSVLPLMSTMKRYNGTDRSWVLREGNAHDGFYDTKHLGHWEIQELFKQDDIIQSMTGKPTRKIYSRELVLDRDELTTGFQTLPPTDAPICFREAVVGTGSQCGQAYCERNIPTSIYNEFSEKMARNFWPTREAWTHTANVGNRGFLLQKASKEDMTIDRIYAQGPKDTVKQVAPSEEQMLSNDGSPMNCLLNTKYFNFENPANVSGPRTEASERIGMANPDALLGDTPKRIVVALVQRESSRTVVNLEKLQDELVAKGFRVKYITFDHGCGLPATAYLLRDVDFMVTPHGNAIGTSLFMPRRPHSTVLSIDNTLYDEPWFMWTTSAVGTRFLQHQNGPHRPDLDPKVYPIARNMKTALYTLGYSNLKLNRGRNAHSMVDVHDPDDELLILTGGDLEAIQRVKSKHANDLDKVNNFLADYWKEAPRYLDVAKVIKMAEQIEQDSIKDADRTFVQLCLENRCCGNYCEQVGPNESVFLRNVVGNHAAHGMLTAPGDWGKYRGPDGVARLKTADELAKEYIPGEQLKSWKMEL
ncbi:hypothetical protein BG005_007443 [Podila minutissima]|nr:hypothetical protein BG005_007443 [Podila minutissima]